MRNGPPKSSQFWLPLTSVPATTTSTSSASDVDQRRGRPTSRQARTGSREAHHISGSPMATHIACLLTIANDEPVNANATTLDAENTMTRPSTSSRVLAPSSR